MPTTRTLAGRKVIIVEPIIVKVKRSWWVRIRKDLFVSHKIELQEVLNDHAIFISINGLLMNNYTYNKFMKEL